MVREVAVNYTEKELFDLGVKHGAQPLISSKISLYGVLEVGDHVRIDDGCIFTGDVRIGDYCHIAPYCVFYGKGGIIIGDYSGFSTFCVLHSEIDDYTGGGMPGAQIPPAYRGALFSAPIIVGNSVSGGTRTTIMPGVCIGDGVSIGAHSMVKSNCDAWGIYAGVPSKLIRMKDGQQRMLLEKAMTT